MNRTARLCAVVLLAGLQLLQPMLVLRSQERSDDLPAFEPPPLPLGLRVESREVDGMGDVLFYGPRVPRVHEHGGRRVSERIYYDIAGDAEMARVARNHRAINIALGTATILSFFGGMVLFGAADQVDYTRVGLAEGTRGRVLSLGLVAGSLAPAAVLMIRGPHAATLEYAYRTMERYNSADGAPVSPPGGVPSE